MDWTADRVDRLTHAWEIGASLDDIVEMLGGVTRNAVISKASRLGLPGRHKRAAVPVLPLDTVPGRVKTCQWPVDQPGRPGFHFCGAAVKPGKPYCAGHCETAYVTPKQWQAENAEGRNRFGGPQGGGAKR